MYNFQIKTIRHELYNHPKRSLSRVDDDDDIVNWESFFFFFHIIRIYAVDVVINCSVMRLKCISFPDRLYGWILFLLQMFTYFNLVIANNSVFMYFCMEIYLCLCWLLSLKHICLSLWKFILPSLFLFEKNLRKNSELMTL